MIKHPPGHRGRVVACNYSLKDGAPDYGSWFAENNAEALAAVANQDKDALLKMPDKMQALARCGAHMLQRPLMSPHGRFTAPCFHAHQDAPWQIRCTAPSTHQEACVHGRGVPSFSLSTAGRSGSTSSGCGRTCRSGWPRSWPVRRCSRCGCTPPVLGDRGPGRMFESSRLRGLRPCVGLLHSVPHTCGQRNS